MSTRANWTLEQDECLIDVLLEQVRKGRRADSGFKKEAWTAAVAAVNKRFGLHYSAQQVKSRQAQFKVEYKVFHSLKQNSGFGWNEESKIPTAPDEVWESYLESHPKAAKYRRKTLPLYEKLFELFEGTIATGEYAFGPDGFPASNAEYDSDSVNMQSSITASEPLVEDELGSGELDEDQQAESSPEGSPPSSKRRRVRSSRGKSPGIVLAESIDRLTDSREASTFTPETWSNRATEEFFKSIADDMSEDKVCFALEVLEDSKKAAIFLKIPSIPVRLLWMERQIEQVVARSSS